MIYLLGDAADRLEAAEARVRELEAEVEALTNNGEALARVVNDMRGAGLALMCFRMNAQSFRRGV